MRRRLDQSSPATGAKLSARLLAMLALVVAFAIVVFVIAQSLGDSDSGTADRKRGAPEAGQVDVVGRGGHVRPAGEGRAAVYVVKPGDTLTTIAEKTGLSVEELQELNPSIDPQALISGQRIKLR